GTASLAESSEEAFDGSVSREISEDTGNVPQAGAGIGATPVARATAHDRRAHPRSPGAAPAAGRAGRAADELDAAAGFRSAAPDRRTRDPGATRARDRCGSRWR